LDISFAGRLLYNRDRKHYKERLIVLVHLPENHISCTDMHISDSGGRFFLTAHFAEGLTSSTLSWVSHILRFLELNYDTDIPVQCPRYTLWRLKDRVQKESAALHLQVEVSWYRD